MWTAMAHKWVRHPVSPSLPVLLLALLALGGTYATIDNATGAVRENSLPVEQQQPLGDVSPLVTVSGVNQSIGKVDTDTQRTSSLAAIAATATTSAITTTTTTTTTQATTTTNVVVPSSSLPSEVSSSIEQNLRPPPPSADEFPPNCSEFNMSPVHLVYSEMARIHKCCPPGQMIQPQSNLRYECVPGNRELQIETVDAQFYGNNECIEVGNSESIVLPVESHDLCAGEPNALMYSADQGDELFVLQNGSLLVLEAGSLVSVFDSYCVEMTNDTQLLAKVCDDGRSDRLSATKPLILLGMALAVVALLLTALCYSFVPRLKGTFGYLIACHAGTFAIGTIFIGLARCGDRCIDPASTAITEVFANALLGSSVYVFFLMNVYNTMYVAYYIPNGLEYDNKNKRDVYLSIAVLYIVSLMLLFLFPKGGLIGFVFLYFAATAVTHVLAGYYTRRLLSGIYQHIVDAPGGQMKINQSRLNDISEQRCLCLMETTFGLICWIFFAWFMLQTNMADVWRICAMYSIVFQGLFIGVVYVGGKQRWVIVRECWSYSGSVDLRAVENAIEMKPMKRAPVPRPEDRTGTDCNE